MRRTFATGGSREDDDDDDDDAGDDDDDGDDDNVDADMLPESSDEDDNEDEEYVDVDAPNVAFIILYLVTVPSKHPPLGSPSTCTSSIMSSPIEFISVAESVEAFQRRVIVSHFSGVVMLRGGGKGSDDMGGGGGGGGGGG